MRRSLEWARGCVLLIRLFVRSLCRPGSSEGRIFESGRERAVPLLARFASMSSLIPVRLITDACPISMADGLDSFGIVNEETPSFNASLDDFVVGVPDQGAELIFAEVFPHIFHWIELWAIGRQGKKRDIFRYDQSAAPLMPSRAITK